MSLNGPEVSLAKDFHSQRNVKTLVPSSTEHHVVSVVLRRKKRSSCFLSTLYDYVHIGKTGRYPPLPVRNRPRTLAINGCTLEGPLST
jgi:hypothetical protein